mmetsp:Transcript_14223/g.27275  ORF Transcript_14223/g.27275 Transcript_14223/m.27275 type:complete len:207 (+) Transcript_14223:496-1116(+)
MAGVSPILVPMHPVLVVVFAINVVPSLSSVIFALEPPGRPLAHEGASLVTSGPAPFSVMVVESTAPSAIAFLEVALSVLPRRHILPDSMPVAPLPATASVRNLPRHVTLALLIAAGFAEPVALLVVVVGLFRLRVVPLVVRPAVRRPGLLLVDVAGEGRAHHLSLLAQLSLLVHELLQELALLLRQGYSSALLLLRHLSYLLLLNR